jgi:hypothetical protein
VTQPIMGYGGAGGGMISLSGTPADPFMKRAPKPAPTVDAVKLTKDNLAKVVWHVLQETTDALIVRSGHDAITIGSNTFESGNWIVREWDRDALRTRYRRPTSQEIGTFELV